MVHSGYRWYLVAFDLDRDDWRTFRIDRIRGRLRLGERGRRRTVPGGDPAAFVSARSAAAAHAGAPAARSGSRRLAEALRRRIPDRYATVEPDGDAASLVTTRGPWSPYFLVWMAMLDEPIQVLGPPRARRGGPLGGGSTRTRRSATTHTPACRGLARRGAGRERRTTREEAAMLKRLIEFLTLRWLWDRRRDSRRRRGRRR